MKEWIRSIVNLYIYSSLHISIVATLFCAETYFIVCHEIDLLYLGIVFCSTMMMYSLHRIIGITKISSELIEGRYRIILKYKSHLKIYVFIALLGIIFFMISSTYRYLIFMIPLGLISILYTVPLLSKKKRLRDISYIKIFLISIVWSGISVGPILVSDQPVDIVLVSLLSIEKLIYILAITLPFDIRDLAIDKSLVTMTIPHRIGIKNSYRLSYVLLIVGLSILAYISIGSDLYPMVLYFTVAYLLTMMSLIVSKSKSSDYYYSGLLDGIIGVRSLIIIIGCIS